MVKGDGFVPILQKLNIGGIGGKEGGYVWYSKADLESFFMLFLDNLASLLGILGAMAFGVPGIVGLPGEYFGAFTEMVFFKVVPGIAFALLFGNLYYAWMACKLAAYEDRQDVTALPYGINTPAGFLFAFNVMLPVAFQYADGAFDGTMSPTEYADAVFNAACALNFLCGLFEIIGSIIGNFVRENMCKAALYAPIASVGFVWLGYAPFVMTQQEPIIGMIPLALGFAGFFANKGEGVYGGAPVCCVLIFVYGIIAKWAGFGRHAISGQGTTVEDFGNSLSSAAETYPGINKMTAFTPLAGFPDAVQFIPLVIPVAIQSFIETMENVEAAAARGDHYPVREAMICDGAGTAIGALFGATMPTTVYIGHVRHKAIGSKCAYSIGNGVLYFILMMSGLFPVIYQLVDVISSGVILIFVGLLIVQQAFACSASRHHPALCIGLMTVISDPHFYDMATDCDTGKKVGDRAMGLANLSPGGGIMCSLIIPQILCDITDCRFIRGAVYSLIACIFSVTGIMHGNNATAPNDEPLNTGEITFSVYKEGGNEGWRFAVAYAAVMVFCLFHHGLQVMGKIPQPILDNGVRSDWDDAVLKDIQVKELPPMKVESTNEEKPQTQMAPDADAEIDC
jgi:xanthine/uracil/vitamin C permease (AzgA family)